MAWMRVGLDVEAAGKQAEVQKEKESVTDWTLKQRVKQAEVQKEQESVTDWTLKLREACGSPKGARKRDGLDVEAAGKQAEVQKEQESVTDWTLKLWGSRQRSKRSKKA